MNKSNHISNYLKPLVFLMVLNILLLFSKNTTAQTISMDQLPIEDALRRLQLMGKIESTLSFNARPLQAPTIHSWDSALRSLDTAFYSKGIKKLDKHFFGKWGYISLLPVQLQQQYVTAQPYSELDGPMITSSGYQLMASVGFYAKLGPLSIQIQPQYVSATNNDYLGVAQTANFKKTFWGNSSVRLNAGPVSLGISSENITWGPSLMNPLLMSSHAPGFIHATFNSRRPWRTPIGSFEWQLIGGYLDTLGQEYNQLAAFPGAALPGKRYFNGAMISYQPKGVKGLSLGVMRTVQENESELIKYGQYILLFNNVARINDQSYEQEQSRDQYASLFIRWLWQPSKVEIYTEWGRNDTYYTMRDFIQQPEHSRAYTYGLRKIIGNEVDALSKNINAKTPSKYWQIITEYTRIQQPPSWPVRSAFSWYEHSRVLQGYTQAGEYLGAPIGIGGNYGMIRVSKFEGWKQYALQLESTTQHADEFEDTDLAYTNPSLHKWIDYGFRILVDYPFKNFLISSTIAMKRSFNYNFVQSADASGLGISNPNDQDSYLFKLAIRYR